MATITAAAAAAAARSAVSFAPAVGGAGVRGRIPRRSRRPRSQTCRMSLKEWFEESRKISGLVDLIQRKGGSAGPGGSAGTGATGDLDPKKSSRGDPAGGNRLWAQCDNCESLLYLKYLRENKSVCEECGYHLPMSSSDRVDLLIDAGTWRPLDEDLHAADVLGFSVDDATAYADHVAAYQTRTGLADAVQTGTGALHGRPVALAVMDFQFMGGSMGSVVGEKLTRLIEHASASGVPVVTVCASGGARMQEGSFSLMQMAKVSAALSVHQLQKRLLYVSVVTHPTTGGVTASFGMLGDVIIAEPKAYVAFAGKRVIEQALGQKIGDDLQKAEHLFEHGQFDLIVPRTLMKGVLSELFELYSCAPNYQKVVA
uniref:Acetyl co-enzyme A carboxylase beta subunit 1 n=1 Tax=Gnetum ula TaxID=3383 RepID=A0A499UEV2_9SPER|nr:acetyl co-enzyme A carboxylase beta subunit 1 [Gnetum ula]